MKNIKFIIGVLREKGIRGGKTEVQSILIPIQYALEQVKNWLCEHGYKYGLIDKSKNYWRARQHEPEEFMRLRTIGINVKQGIRKNPSLDYHKGRLVVLTDKFNDGRLAAVKQAIYVGRHAKSLGKSDKFVGSDGETKRAYHQVQLVQAQKKYNKQIVKDKKLEGRIAEEQLAIEHSISQNPQPKTYVGITFQAKPKLFTSHIKPTQAKFGRQFMQIHGPFKSYIDAERFEDRLRTKHKMNPILGKLSVKESNAFSHAYQYGAKYIKEGISIVKAFFINQTKAENFVAWLVAHDFKYKIYTDKNGYCIVSFKEN